MGDNPKAVAVVPVGPRCDVTFVRDTLVSIRRFVPECRLIIMDDSGRGTGTAAAEGLHATIVPTRAPDDPPFGKSGGLYLTLSRAFIEALTEPFDLLLRIDTDALVVGGTFVRASCDAFAADPQLAVAGSDRDNRGGRSGPARAAIIRRLFNPRYVLRNPRRAVRLWRLAYVARRNGYPLGSYVFGGVCVYSAPGLRSLHEHGLLELPELAALHLSEDHLFGLLITGTRGHLAELRRDGQSLMGTRWKQLPDSPEQLVADRRELVHSVRQWNNLGEAEIRDAFRALREHD